MGSSTRLVRDGPAPHASCPHCGGELQVATVGERWSVRRPADVADRLTLQLGTLEREELHVLVLDTRNVVLDQERVYQGNVSAAIARIGELFRGAVARHGKSIILCHNHPSGDLEPSADDLRLTAEAIAAGRLLDIDVLDHIIVGGASYSSLRDDGFAFSHRLDGHAIGERAGPWWRDPRYGTYKSALQEWVRRGEVDKAVAAGDALARLPIGRGMLGRRLIVITAEDVGWRHLPATFHAVEASLDLPDPEAIPRLLDATAALSSMPKQKEAYWLANLCWDGRRTVPEVSQVALEDALRDARYADAVAICMTAKDERLWRSGERVIDAFRHTTLDAPPLTHEIIDCALKAEAKTGSGSGELMATAVIAAIDRPDGPTPQLPTVSYAVPSGPPRLEWYTQDSHTPIGKRALTRISKHTGLSLTQLEWLMFDYESIRLGPSEDPARWRGESLGLDAKEGGWESEDRGRELWDRIRGDVRRAIRDASQAQGRHATVLR